MQGNRPAALSYVKGFNDKLASNADCADLYDQTVSDAASAEIPAPDMSDMTANMMRALQGDFLGVERMGSQVDELNTLYDNGAKDAVQVVEALPDECDDDIIARMVANAKAFVRAKPAAASPQQPASASPRSTVQPSRSGSQPARSTK
jgi:hypothetical protein